MRKAYLILSLVFLCIAMSACDKKACERYCNSCSGENIDLFGDYISDFDYYGNPVSSDVRTVVPGSSDCADECQDQLDGEPLSCKSAFRRAARCLDQLSCKEDECDTPIWDVESECDF